MIMDVLFVAIIALCIIKCNSSVGDRAPYYRNCVDQCRSAKCSSDGALFNDLREQFLHLQLLQWSCEDECKYECMWRTVEVIKERGWKTPQFHGKWPFIRFFGVQEPAAALFSFFNYYAHAKMMKRFEKKVPRDAPLYWLWHAFSVVGRVAWICSTIFHTRDLPLTEFLDYASAFSLVLMTFYCMIVRMLWGVSRFVLIVITVLFLAFFGNHVAYLYSGSFDYGYNMLLNILIGTITAVCWFFWCTFNRKRQPYVWKCAVFVSLAGFVLLLELMDVAPFWWVFDCHALWHLSTAPLICLLYSFAIDDCKYLRQRQGGDKKI